MVQAIFKEVERGEIENVRARLEAKPELISVTATGAPKKYVGQSLLQIALRTAKFDIADMLVAMGADVNYYDKANVNTWAAPVVHDAAVAALLGSRWASASHGQRSDAAFATLVGILDAGADVHALDSYGNSLLGRAVAQANDILPKPHVELEPEIVEDMSRIFSELISRGVDLNRIEPSYTHTIVEFNHLNHVAQFLVPATHND